MIPGRAALVSLVLFVVVVSAPAALAYQASTSQGADPHAKIMQAYTQLLDTYYATGLAPSTAIAQLNSAIEKASQADLVRETDPSTAASLDSEAQQIASQVHQDLLTLKSIGLEQKLIGYAIIASSAIIVSALSFMAYRFGPIFMWKAWLRLRGGAIIRAGTPISKPARGDAEEGDDQPLTMEDVSMFIALALVVIAGIIVVQPILAGIHGEQFSELGVLGPNMTIGGYPTSVTVGSNVSLYTFVGNHMGQPVWYKISIKLGDNESQVNPLTKEPICAIEKVVADDETWLNPINIHLPLVGNNQRIIFELYSMNSSSGIFEYTGRWNQIWVNITTI